mgnify:FL=1
MEIIVANSKHSIYAETICENIAEAAKVRGTGIAQRETSYIISKIEKGNAVIALDGDRFAGFAYIEVWGHGKFVANSGLIVHPNFRNQGLAKLIKQKVFERSRQKFPEAKIFSITTGLPVMKMNSELGYRPVTFSELTDDQSFWDGCQSCKNYEILQSKKRKMCFCTGMLFDPEEQPKPAKKKRNLNLRNWKKLKLTKPSILKKTKS